MGRLDHPPRLSRRALLRSGAGAALAAGLPWSSWSGSLEALARASGAPVRKPNSLPDPHRPAGESTAAMPFDHVIVVMMENHSFDNYLGMLPRRGQRKADGFKFDRHGHPANRQPLDGGYVLPLHATSNCQPIDVTQSWNGTHIQIDRGRMDGFAKTDQGAMLYWDEQDIPFYYSLAKTFTLGNRWFCSAPCQTFPNRRFLLAATAYGLISTDFGSVNDPPPANGTLFDRLAAHGVSWKNYFTDLPGTGVIAAIPKKYPQSLAPINQFYVDCAAGTLPAVSFLDPEFGAASDIGGAISGAHIPGVTTTETQGGDEENPQDITFGEDFVSQVVNAVLQSPAWPRTLLVWTYDEHGGYLDHVPPPRAIPPDGIKPKLGPHDIKGGYDIYGPRVPAVVVSPHSRPHATTNMVHDHTSILATIEAKWNLPACTYRDANATTLMDFLDTSRAAFAEPPTLAAPHDLGSTEQNCSTADPKLTVHHAPRKHKKPKHHHKKHHHKKHHHHGSTSNDDWHPGGPA
jgi:phospholipase C